MHERIGLKGIQVNAQNIIEFGAPRQSRGSAALGDLLGDQLRDTGEKAAVDPTSQESSSPPDASGAFQRWRALGYTDLVPVVPVGATLSAKTHTREKDIGKAPGIRYSDGTWGAFKGWHEHVAAPDDLMRWQDMGASVGLRRGRVLILDIDAYDQPTGDRIEAMALAMLGPAPLRVGNWPKRALLYRTDVDVFVGKLTFTGANGKTGQIETPKQVVVEGTHSATGRPYEWRRPIVPYKALTLIDQTVLSAFLDVAKSMLPAAVRDSPGPSVDRQTVDQSTLRGDPETVAKAVRSLPNTRELFPHYDDMVRVGQAIHAALPEDEALGKELWHEWCERWEGGDNEPGATERRWGTFYRPHSVGANYLFWMAEKHGAGFSRGERWFEEPLAGEPLFPAEVQDVSGDGGRFEFVPFDAAADGALMTGSRPLIKGLLDQGAMTVLYGESNVGKTFVAMDIAHSIACGRDWGGMRTTQLPVLYVAAEGGQGARRRAAALKARHGGADLQYLLHPIDLLRPNADLGALLEAIGRLGQPLGLIVIDTLSRALAGGDENSSTDMGALVKNLDRLRKKTGAHILVVHHSGKDASRGARGHSLLRAATDTEIEVRDGQIAVTKQRDMDGSWSSPFDLEPVELGRDEDGDVVTSCVVRLRNDDEEPPIVDETDLAKIAERVRQGTWRMSSKGQARKSWIGVPVAAALDVDISGKATEVYVAAVIDDLIRTGRMLVRERRNGRSGRTDKFVEIAPSASDWFQNDMAEIVSESVFE